MLVPASPNILTAHTMVLATGLIQFSSKNTPGASSSSDAPVIQDKLTLAGGLLIFRQLRDDRHKES